MRRAVQVGFAQREAFLIVFVGVGTAASLQGAAANKREWRMRLFAGLGRL